MPVLISFAESAETGNALMTAFKTGIEAVKTDVTGFATVALPVGLGIMALFMAVRYGIKFFKTVSK